MTALQATSATWAVLSVRLADLASQPQSDLLDRIDMTQTGQAYAVDMVPRLQAAVAQAASALTVTGCQP